MRIGVTNPMDKASDFDRYMDWLRLSAAGAQLVPFTVGAVSPDEVGGVDGLVLSGGGDVHPELYGRPQDAARARGVNIDRDRFELELVRLSLERGCPLLGICRGAQLVNVALAGTLVVDLESAGYSNHRRPEAGDRRHAVQITPGSVLREIAGAESGEINSSHHQAVQSPGRGLQVTARSDDGVVEALEWAERDGRPFLLLVQWHPERMEAASRLSSGVRERFVAEVKRCTARTQ